MAPLVLSAALIGISTATGRARNAPAWSLTSFSKRSATPMGIMGVTEVPVRGVDRRITSLGCGGGDKTQMRV